MLKTAKTPQTCNNFPQQWQRRLGYFDLCVLFIWPSASCCDIQTELRVISLGDLWLPHESWSISGGGSPGGRSLASLRQRTCTGLRPPPQLLLSPPQPGGCLAADLQMTRVGLVWSEAERGQLNNAGVPAPLTRLITQTDNTYVQTDKRRRGGEVTNEEKSRY